MAAVWPAGPDLYPVCQYMMREERCRVAWKDAFDIPNDYAIC
jgi:hypothetical protein